MNRWDVCTQERDTEKRDSCQNKIKIKSHW